MKLVDVAIDRFVGLLGYAPRSVAAPYIDALTLDYLHSKYKISASANFMDQCGTHNRTIWGAPYAGAYFPSKQNALIPASTPEQQIGVPIFRMRGPDPIHQYDLDLGEPAQDALTFEPLENNGGSSPEWMGVYLDMLAKAPALALSYSQAGFRSHFQWDEVKDGMALQIQEFVKRREAGELEFECLGDTGAWFQKSFSATPPQATVALLDTLGGDRRSIWYHSKFYRANLLLQADAIRIRDLHLFDENYPERYLNSECRENTAVIDTLPVLDGYRWSNKDHRAWGTPMLMKNGVVDHPLRAADNPIVREHGSVLEVEFPLAADDGILRIVFD